MDLKFTEEQIILRDMVKSLCEDYSTMETVRAVEKDPVGIPTELWQQMRETGLLGMMLPEEHGGMGLGMLDCAVIFQELGAGLAPGPYFDSAVMAVNVLKLAGSDAQKKDLLPAIGSGELILSNAWLEPDNGFGPQGVQMRADRQGEGYVLNGVKRHVFYAKAAQKLIVLARTGDATDAVDLFLVDTDAAGLTLEQQHSMAWDSQYKVTFDKVQISAADRIGAEGSGWATWEAAMYQGIILLAAWATGGADRALAMTVQYSKEREQFDKPIGAFQALAHYMSDAYTVVEGAKVLVLEAAWAFDQGHSVRRLAPMAKLFACKTFRDTTAKCEQIHGGYGFTLEYDIQLYFRRAKQLQMNWWDSRYLEDLVAAEVLDTDGRTIDDPFKV
ncbi:MAG: acyl-CoA/acyl-ACP dehydrogenase [Halioglobus sp.]|nr:acyl-CoA/acyl-ACP dehydrogenase [Halioglobus sp.]